MEIKSKEHYQNLIKKLDRKSAYEIYIASPNWKKKREERLKLDNWECRTCGSKDNLHVHHKYPKAYKDIPDENVNYDLITLCEFCHMAIHNSLNERRYQDRDIKIQSISPPREAERKLISYGVENSTVQIEWSEPVDSTQWRSGQSFESDSKSSEENLWETREDRSRFNGIG